MESKNFGLFVLLICGLLSFVASHNWLDTPVSRGDQRDTQTGCRFGGEGNPTCSGPCDRTVSQISIAPTLVQRGQAIDIKWNMHNHPGGFIRFAWCPTSESDSHECFNSYVQEFTCKQHGGCSADSPLCDTSIDVPIFVTDGAWTLQWAYFGGYYNAGDYYACVDYTVSGGTAVGSQQAPTFTGGDTTYPDQDVCLFYSTNALGVCTVEPCLNGTFPGGNQVGAPLGFNAEDTPTPSTSTTGSQPSTTAAPQPSTTGAVKPSTTGAVKPSTTGAVRPSTTAAVKPATTAAPSPVTTAAPQPSTTLSPQPSTTGRRRPPIAVTTSIATTAAATTSVATTSVATTAAATTGAMKPSTTSVATTASSKPSTTASAPSTTASATTAATATDSACTLGHQICVTSETYQTCTNGRTANYWAASQSCQVGLTCHPSGTNIYCY